MWAGGTNLLFIIDIPDVVSYITLSRVDEVESLRSDQGLLKPQINILSRTAETKILVFFIDHVVCKYF